MWLNENLIKFIESSTEISKVRICVSDLKNLRICAVPGQDAVVINKIISRELLESLLIIGTGIEQDKYIITNSKTNSIPLLDNESKRTNYMSQIILPLWADNELKGSLILVSDNRKLDDYDLELARSMQIFIEESIINSINEEFLKKSDKKKNKSILKSENSDNKDNKIKQESLDVFAEQEENDM